MSIPTLRAPAREGRSSAVKPRGGRPNVTERGGAGATSRRSQATELNLGEDPRPKLAG